MAATGRTSSVENDPRAYSERIDDSEVFKHILITHSAYAYDNQTKPLVQRYVNVVFIIVFHYSSLLQLIAACVMRGMLPHHVEYMKMLIEQIETWLDRLFASVKLDGNLIKVVIDELEIPLLPVSRTTIRKLRDIESEMLMEIHGSLATLVQDSTVAADAKMMIYHIFDFTQLFGTWLHMISDILVNNKKPASYVPAMTEDTLKKLKLDLSKIKEWIRKHEIPTES